MSEKENEEVTGQEQETNDTANSTSENGETQEEENVIEEQVAESVKEPTLEEKYAELNNKYVRLYSDFDNFRKRTIKEKADIISTANGSLMADLLGKKIIIKKSSLRKGGTKKRLPNITKIKKLGFIKKFNLKQGLMKTLQFYY